MALGKAAVATFCLCVVMVWNYECDCSWFVLLEYTGRKAGIWGVRGKGAVASHQSNLTRKELMN